MLRLLKKTTRSKNSGKKTAAISLCRITKSYGTTPAVQEIELTVQRGATLILFGPSGCGKTTLLRLIAGLERPDRGEIWLGSHLVSNSSRLVPADARHIGMVFQDLALWPHMTAVEHVIFALPKSYSRGADKKTMASRLLQLVKMTKADRYPHQLSGGEQQRLAIARALAGSPRILLLDEPFSSLDEELRASLLVELQTITKELGLTTVHVTHRSHEAAILADEIVILDRGRRKATVSPDDFIKSSSTANTMIDQLPTRIQNRL